MRLDLVVRIRSVVGRLRGDDGAALTEFAMTFFLYIAVVMGTIQIAMWAFTASATQFAVWEGCRAGVAAYQPPPPDATRSGSLSSQQVDTDAEYALQAANAAVDQVEEMLDWMPVTKKYSNLEATIDEEAVAPGAQGRRDIVVKVKVKPIVLFPMGEQWFGGGSDGLVFDRACRQRLHRFYSY